MALTIGINTYVSLAEATKYFLNRLDSSAWDEAVDIDKESSLSTASNMLDENTFIGQALDSNQPLAWPRQDISYFDSRLNLLVRVPSGDFPMRLKVSVCELALHLLNNEDLLNNSGRVVDRITVGPISIDDSSSESRAPPRIPIQVTNTIAPLIFRMMPPNVWWRAN